MDTPICDFVSEYEKSNSLRLHMPGHKGVSYNKSLGEALDITEIDGADVLYQPKGIILESEKNASELFGTARTVYSAEGSSLAIKAMLYLALMNWKRNNSLRENCERPIVLAARNVHKTFVSAAAMLDFDVKWIYPENGGILSCEVTPERLSDAFEEMTEKEKKGLFAVYITSPDYLGNMADVAALSAICKERGIMLLVDNAHGAYLKFLTPSIHPIDLGADMCCDSAHKTLPVLTGGAYLHISQLSEHREWLSCNADTAMSLFASTSPSYLILQSLDSANRFIYDNYITARSNTDSSTLSAFVEQVSVLKQSLVSHGYTLCGNEPLKITIAAKLCGYTGDKLTELLAEKGIVCEFSDPDFTVLMLTPSVGESGLKRLSEALLSISFVLRDGDCLKCAPSLETPRRVMSIREAVFSPSIEVPAEEAVGKVAANVTVGCPPAVPIAVCGEIIDESAAQCFKYYGIKFCRIVDFAIDRKF